MPVVECPLQTSCFSVWHVSLSLWFVCMLLMVVREKCKLTVGGSTSLFALSVIMWYGDCV